MNANDSPQLIATAYHEAGHAVVALALGRIVHRVSILPNRDRLGQCEFRKGTRKKSHDELETEILIALAGMAAEAKHTGSYDRAAAGRDLRHAHTLLLQRGSERSKERHESRMLSKVESLLNDDSHWSAVTSIAAELLKHGIISGRAADYFFERALTAGE